MFLEEQSGIASFEQVNLDTTAEGRLPRRRERELSAQADEIIPTRSPQASSTAHIVLAGGEEQGLAQDQLIGDFDSEARRVGDAHVSAAPDPRPRVLRGFEQRAIQPSPRQARSSEG